MSSVQQSAGPAVAPSATGTHDLRAILLRVAWLSVLLGLTMQILLAVIQINNIQPLAELATEFLQKIAWSFVVCMGVGVGMAISQASPVLTGLAGMIAAPVGFNVARSLQKGTSELLGAASPAAGPDPVLIASIRGLEYLCLGAAIAWIAHQAWGGVKAHIGVGLALGLIFGGAVLLFTSHSVPSAVALLSLGVNEIMFPVGCSLILFASETLGKKVLG